MRDIAWPDLDGAREVWVHSIQLRHTLDGRMIDFEEDVGREIINRAQ